MVQPGNLLSRCPELLKFLGAYTPVSVADGSGPVKDGYGRKDVRRDELDSEKLKNGTIQVKTPDVEGRLEMESRCSEAESMVSEEIEDTAALVREELKQIDEKSTDEKRAGKNSSGATKKAAIAGAAVNRASKIRLKEVRKSIFDVLRHLFDLDNASFFRSRMISTLKTMSAAVTSAQDFHRTLFHAHMKYVNGDAISQWILMVVNLFWPNGVFYTKGPELTFSEKTELKCNSKKALKDAFPDQLRTLLGKHTDDGVDMLHEMLQNRIVLKSMAYMLLDMVWADLFPELNGFVSGSACLNREE